MIRFHSGLQKVKGKADGLLDMEQPQKYLKKQLIVVKKGSWVMVPPLLVRLAPYFYYGKIVCFWPIETVKYQKDFGLYDNLEN
jgi:hypothetical protein